MTINKYVIHGDRLMQVKDSTKLDSLVKFSDVHPIIQRLEEQLETAIKWLEWQQQNPKVINHNLTLFLAEVKEDLKR